MGDNFGARGRLVVGDERWEIFRLEVLGALGDVWRLPFSLKVLVENLVRNEDGQNVRPEDVEGLVAWDGVASGSEIAFTPARVLLQDFTGVPAIVDLAAMRDAMEALGADPARVNPLIPAELVIDHSVIVDVFGRADAAARNVELEFSRNRERYQLLRWGAQAFDNLRVVPPGTGICHQVNLEYLARVVFTDDAGRAYPDTLVGTDSHTPMVNGLGVVGWGVGGIEAEAALLGQPISMLVPQVVGFRLSGGLPEGSTATDLVLRVTEMLRRRGVVGKFVEFYGPGVSQVPLENRATIGNMSPEYGSTITIFPIDAETLRYLAATGRPPGLVALVEAYAKEQGLWHDPSATPVFSETLELDLSTVEPSLAGPARPQDRVPLDRAKTMFGAALAESAPDIADGSPEEASSESFPASDPPAAGAGVTAAGRPDAPAPTSTATVSARPVRRVPLQLGNGPPFELDHGHVVIAAITSCTNTSNPQVMLAAGLLAKKAVEAGLSTKPWVKTSLAPGSQVVMDYYERAGLLPYLEKLGFHLVGFGCTTCIGNSGPLAEDISRAVTDNDLAVVAVLSGNRNFEGRIHPDVRMSYLASPPLVVAYALVGTMDVDLTTEAIGTGAHGQSVFLGDLWPSSEEVSALIRDSVHPEAFRQTYGDVFTGDKRWDSLPVPAGGRYAWDPASTYVARPPFLAAMTPEPPPLGDIVDARVLAVLGDSITTDHISPAGTIAPDSPAGLWLTEHGVERAEFNSYGARRGNHEVMIRGTFANPRIRNRLAPGTEGGMTLHLPGDEPITIYEAGLAYAADGIALVVLAGKEYGSGSSRDWAAKGTALLGVRAVLAESFERIHRSNLIGMGVLPLQFPEGESADSLGLTGHERYTVAGLSDVGPGDPIPDELTVQTDERHFRARVRIDTPREADYYRHGGILRYVARHLAGRREA
jgi:aconitate hydratase